MPAPIISHPEEDIRTMILATGSIKETAEAFGYKEETIRSLAFRRKWPTPSRALKKRREADKDLAEVRQHRRGETKEYSASNVLQEHMERTGKKFKTNLATALASASDAVGQMDGMSVMDNSRKLVDLVTAGKTIFGMGEESKGAQLQVNVLSLSLDNIAGACKTTQVIDV